MVINYHEVTHETRVELRQRIAEREQLDKRINELRTALRALIKFIPEAERQQAMEEVKNAKRTGVSLVEAIADILDKPEHKTGLTSKQIREQLEESGFDLEDYSQPLAAVMTTLQRLVEQQRVKRTFSSKEKGGVIFRAQVQPGAPGVTLPTQEDLARETSSNVALPPILRRTFRKI